MNLNTIFYTAGILLLFSCKENQSNKNTPEPNSSLKREKIVTGQQIQKTKAEEDPGQASVQETGSIWNGKYSGSFLRLKDETADPRAWGQIHLHIHGKSATLSIDSYVENVQKKLKLFSESKDELRLKDISDGKSLTLSKKFGTITMEGNLMESIVGISEKYEIEKTVR
ncbi:hypothetical protein [Chryseobacterium sp. Bi04]|uniref:hypothetical protein n=1 Tax=Chryseobacterium sp. Bi04 TaxID=2822345 RepID=UPI001DAD9F36|nr:hypothetical protein [Chryseobacterium sp. Bi04]CAH0266677.1 hypothetical protein SRABI04_03646 [Chryseobacterium sp. Bi04]